MGDRRLFALATAVVMALIAAPPAQATFHHMMVREVYPGSIAHPDSEYVELQMWAPGQNFVDGHSIGLYDASGAPVGTATFTHDASGNANQSTLVAATAEAEAEFGIAADTGLNPGLLNPAGGAVCWESLDCVVWGNFAGSAKSPVGSAAAAGGIPDGMALQRTIEPGCATLLESGDDSDNSAADFSLASPAPRPNSVTPSEHACSSQAGGGGGAQPGGGSGGGTGSTRPQTQIRKHPGNRTRDRTPTFRFSSNAPGSTYLCKLDSGNFKRCNSPFTAHPLSLGPHLFKVEARAGGATDRSPASFAFTVVRS
jgi:predicted extracellular nuclease